MSKGNNSELSFERKTNSDGAPNPKYVDLLEEDKPISGQKFVCVSFVLVIIIIHCPICLVNRRIILCTVWWYIFRI